MLTKTTLVLALLTAAAGCSGAVVNVGADPQDAGNAEGGSHPDVSTGPFVVLHVRATEAAFAQTDGFASQTARNEKIGISGLMLLTSASDPSPLMVFQSAPVEAGLNDKEDTVVARVPAKSLKAGTYSVARVPVSHVRFTVSGTYHASGLPVPVPGDFMDIVVLSDGTSIDGQTHDHGWFSVSFATGGMTYGATTGTNPLPDTTDAGGFKLVTAGGHAYYEFPIAPIVVDPGVTSDVNVIFEVNTDHDFHWQDIGTPGYAPNVFDVEMATYEPVKKFGANNFRIFYE